MKPLSQHSQAWGIWTVSLTYVQLSCGLRLTEMDVWEGESSL